MLSNDFNRIRHIFDAANDAVLFIKGKTREDLNSDKLLVYGLVKALEIIGEAAGNISTQTQNKYAEIPWRDMADMRNFLVHEYFGINHDIIWQTLMTDLPQLIENLNKILTKSS